MKYTKSALGLLNAQYKSVLKKCLLINLGLFALAAPAMADDGDLTILDGGTVDAINASGASIKINLNTVNDVVSAVNDASTGLDALNDAITTLKGDATTDGSVAKAVADNNTTLLGTGDGSIAKALGGNGTQTLAEVIAAQAPVQSVVAGTSNGTVKVNGTDLAVTGLDTMAYESASNYTNNTTLFGNAGVTGSIAKAVGGTGTQTLAEAVAGVATTKANDAITTALTGTGAIKSALDTKADDSTVTALDTRVTTAEGKIAANETAITNLTTGSTTGAIDVATAKVGGYDVLTTDSNINIAKIDTTNYTGSDLEAAVKGTSVAGISATSGTGDDKLTTTVNASGASFVKGDGTPTTVFAVDTNAGTVQANGYDVLTTDDIQATLANGVAGEVADAGAVKAALNVAANGNYISAGTGVAANLGALDTNVKGNADAIALLNSGNDTGALHVATANVGDNITLTGSTGTIEATTVNATTVSGTTVKSGTTFEAGASGIKVGTDVSDATTTNFTVTTAGAVTAASLESTADATVGGNLGVTGTSTFTGAVTANGALTANGNVTLGDASTDTITVKGTATFDEQINATNGIKAGANTSLVNGTLTVSTDGTPANTSTLTHNALTTTTVNAGANGTALTNGQLVLNGDGTNAATLTSTANGLNVAEGLTVNGDKFTVDTNGAMNAAGGKFQVDGNGVIQDVRGINISDGDAGHKKVGLSVVNGSATASTLQIDSATLIKGTLGAGSDGTKFTVDADGNTAIAGTLGVTGRTTLSATNGMQFGAGQVVTSIDNTGAAVATGDANKAVLATGATVYAGAKNADYNNAAAGKNIAANSTLGTAITALDTEIGADTDYASTNNGVAGANSVKANISAINAKVGNVADVTVNGYTAATGTLTGAVSALNTNMKNVLGAMYANDGTYTKFAATNGFKDGANLTAQLTDYAANVKTATGGTFTSTGAWAATVNNTAAANGYTYVESANIMDAVNQVAANVGTKAQLTNGYNGVTNAQSVNTNLNAINGTIGDITTLSAGTGSTGNAITNGTGTAATTVVEALNNIDATLGKIHGLKATSDLGEKSNLAAGTTVEQHLVSVDNAIGDRSFATTRYVAPNSDLATAVTSLDSNLNRVEHKVDHLRRDFEAGMASMAAMSALVPNPRAMGDTSLSIGTGYYADHAAVALGGFHYITNNVLLNVGASYSNTDDLAYRMGVTWSW